MVSIDELLAEARAELTRVTPAEARAAAQDGAIIVDIRPMELRQRDGEIPGAHVIDRNVLEWRLDPECEHCDPELARTERVILVCDAGYASSLAAVTLRRLGVDATDMAGGFQAWREEGFPVTAGEARPWG